MNEGFPYLAFLQCPQCMQPTLSTAKNGLRCDNCQLDFPTTAQIPWLYANPQASIVEWQAKYNFFVQQLQNDAEAIKEELKNTQLSTGTTARLRKVLQAKVEHAKEIVKIMEPLAVSEQGQIETSMALRVKLPETQSLMSYYINVLRDWAWGDKENQLSADIVCRAFGDIRPKNILVLGAGAARLAVDVYQKLQPSMMLAIDINPFLFFVAKRLLDHRNVTLYEFPIAPRSADEFAVRTRCQYDGKKPEGFHFLLGDALKPMIRDESFDAVLTPWFVDIVPEATPQLQARINRMLKPGGMWVNFGSLAYSHRESAKCLSRDEFLESLNVNGFQVQQTIQDTIPYMQSPHSCQERSERIFCTAATKAKTVPAPATYEYLPSWLRSFDEPVPQSRALQQLVGVNKIFVGIVGLADGKRSLRDIATMAAPELNMPLETVCVLVQKMFVNIFESQLQGGQF